MKQVEWSNFLTPFNHHLQRLSARRRLSGSKTIQHSSQSVPSENSVMSSLLRKQNIGLPEQAIEKRDS
jgi:hypothetical protein